MGLSAIPPPGEVTLTLCDVIKLPLCDVAVPPGEVSEDEPSF